MGRPGLQTHDSQEKGAGLQADTEHWRPRFHYTPAQHWMNDPNGLCYLGGTWHMFYQFNPLGIDPANMSWGHAVSKDLRGWAELPVALEWEENTGIFSGSVVRDRLGDAGFGEDALVAAYTIAAPGRQSQGLASSQDQGLTWEKHAGNPVLDRGTSDFRDPKIFRYQAPDGKSWWVMVFFF